MLNGIVTVIFVGGVCVFGGYIIKKLNDIHKEIIYFEEQKGIMYNRKKCYKKADENLEVIFKWAKEVSKKK